MSAAAPNRPPASAADIIREARRVARLRARMMQLAEERGRSDPETVAVSQELDRLMLQRTLELSGLDPSAAPRPQGTPAGPSSETVTGCRRQRDAVDAAAPDANRQGSSAAPEMRPPPERSHSRRLFTSRGHVMAPPAELLRILEMAYAERPRGWTAGMVVHQVLLGLHNLRRNDRQTPNFGPMMPHHGSTTPRLKPGACVSGIGTR
jgi:hypothetical protein